MKKILSSLLSNCPIFPHKTRIYRSCTVLKREYSFFWRLCHRVNELIERTKLLTELVQDTFLSLPAALKLDLLPKSGGCFVRVQRFGNTSRATVSERHLVNCEANPIPLAGRTSSGTTLFTHIYNLSTNLKLRKPVYAMLWKVLFHLVFY